MTVRTTSISAYHQHKGNAFAGQLNSLMCAAMRPLRFLASWMRLRSLSCAIWLDAFDNFKPGHGK